jgi:hypothetical protein
MFLLRPDAETNNAFTYCLAEAAQRFGIDVVLPYAASNHHHTIIFDRHRRVCEFLEHFHKLLAKCMNARWGRWENLWAAVEPTVTRLLDVETVIAKLIYAASNPVKDLLVERATQWPGVNGYRELRAGKPLRAKRPRFFFRPDGSMPAELTLELVIPPELGERDAVIAKLEAGVEAVERATREHRLQRGLKLIGRRQLLDQSWKDSPTSVEPRRRLRPRFAGGPSVRIPALIAFTEFLAAYRDARKAWLAGRRAAFPRGTYWLARFSPAPIISSPPPGS